jgi:hypothetical protein
MPTDREKLEARYAVAGVEELSLIAGDAARSPLTRRLAARELERRGHPSPSVPDGEPLPPRRAPVIRDLERPIPSDHAIDPIVRFRAIAVGMKLGAIASVFTVFVLPHSVSSWAIVITGAVIGGGIAFAMTRR